MTGGSYRSDIFKNLIGIWKSKERTNQNKKRNLLINVFSGSYVSKGRGPTRSRRYVSPFLTVLLRGRLLW